MLYFFGNKGNDSSVETPTHKRRYYPKLTLGKGGFATARAFMADDGESLAVLSPNSLEPKAFAASLAEAETKQEFLKQIRPKGRTELITGRDSEGRDTFKLITDLIPGEKYKAYRGKITESNALRLFYHAAKALEACQASGCFYVDLKDDNILYNRTAELIDGGHYVPIDGRLSARFKCKSEKERETAKKLYPHYAPEYWYISEPPQATEAGEVYSLGLMMQKLCFQCLISAHTEALINSCIQLDPKKRPSLAKVKDKIKAIRLIYSTCKAIDNIEINYAELDGPVLIKAKVRAFSESIDKLKSSKDLLSAYKLLGILTDAPEIVRASIVKKNEIINSANRALEQIDTLGENYDPEELSESDCFVI